MSARTAADVPELVEAARAAIGDSYYYSTEFAGRAFALAALSVVPAPLRPIDPDDDEQHEAIQAGWGDDTYGCDAEHSLKLLRDLGTGLPAHVEPSDLAVQAASDAYEVAFLKSWGVFGSEGEAMRTALRAAYAVDGVR